MKPTCIATQVHAVESFFHRQTEWFTIANVEYGLQVLVGQVSAVLERDDLLLITTSYESQKNVSVISHREEALLSY